MPRKPTIASLTGTNNKLQKSRDFHEKAHKQASEIARDLRDQIDSLTADGVRKDETIYQLEARILNLHDQRLELQRAYEAATNRELIMDGIASDMRAIALNLSEALRNVK